MYEEGRDRIGSALRRMAEDLVKERRQVLELRRENRRLRAELEQLRGQTPAAASPRAGSAALAESRPGRASSTTGDVR